MVTKYISDIKTIEEEGNTGIRIEISEDAGDLEVRAVNTEEFTNISDRIDNLEKTAITDDNLKEKADAVGINAGSLNGYSSSNFLLTGAQLLVGRIKANSSGEWEYNLVEGASNSFINFSSYDTVKHGFCLIVRPTGYLAIDDGGTIPVQINGFKSNALANRGYGSHAVSIQDVTFNLMDGTQVTEKCLTCVVTMGWTSSTVENGDITFNYRGKSITRLWQFTSNGEMVE